MSVRFADEGQTWISNATLEPEVIDEIVRGWTAQADTVVTRDRAGVLRHVTRTDILQRYTLGTVNPQF